MATLANSPVIPVGAIKQFGPYGPEYEVLGAAEPKTAKHVCALSSYERAKRPRMGMTR
jgi:hypothetical protein